MKFTLEKIKQASPDHTQGVQESSNLANSGSSIDHAVIMGGPRFW